MSNKVLSNRPSSFGSVKHLKMTINDRYKKYANSKRAGLKAMRKKR